MCPFDNDSDVIHAGSVAPRPRPAIVVMNGDLPLFQQVPVQLYRCDGVQSDDRLELGVGFWCRAYGHPVRGHAHLCERCCLCHN